MSRTTALIIIAFALAAMTSVFADDSTITKPDRYKHEHEHLVTGAVLSAGETGTAVDWDVSSSEYQTLYCSISSSGTPSLAILVTGSVDGTNFAAPSTGATVTTLSADGTQLVKLTLGACVKLRVQPVNGHGTSNTTVTIVGGHW